MYNVKLCNSIPKYINKNSLQKHRQTPLKTTKINNKSYSYFIIFLTTKKSYEEYITQPIKKINNKCKFWLKKYSLSLITKSKQNNQKNKPMKKTEKLLKEFNNIGRSNLSQHEKCAAKLILDKR